MINGKYIVIFFNRTDNFNCQVLPQRTWPSRFQSLLPIFLFYWLKWSRIYSRKLKKIFFSRRQDTPEYSQVFILQKLGFRLYIIFTYFFFTSLPLTIICDQPSSQRSDQSSSWFEVDRRGRAGFEFSSWLAWIFSDNVWQVHKFKSAMTILFTDIVSTTHRVKQETTCNFTARTRILRFFWNWIECAERLNWEL